ncbi:MAG: sigma-54-dependent Fis family transcriptional regulator [Planctomycetes bacterium]|nr:sigma-54-dependent Fis family transcriptional regulator [Planctomycetota bacterium]
MSVGLQSRTGEAAIATGRERVRILVCTGSAGAESDLVTLFAQHGATVQVATDRDSYVAAASREEFDAVLVDLPGQPSASSAWRDEVLDERVRTGTIVIAAPAEREADAVDALGRGARAYLTKPCTARQAVAALLVVADNHRLARRLRALESRLAESGGNGGPGEAPAELIGCSPAVRRLGGVISRAGLNDATVLIEGKPGVGKSLIAELVHRNGRRSCGTLRAVDCDGLTEAGLDDAIQSAAGGTLVLEDVDRLSSRCQSRLVRYLKDAGAGRDVRIVATTAARLAELTAKGTFREDLYYRLNVFPVVVPGLAERREDIPLLARHFLARSAEREGLPDRGFTPGAMILLEAHPWPGNTAQLKQAVLRAHQLADGGPIDRVHLFGPSTGVQPPPDVQGLTDQIGGEDVDAALGEDDIRPFQEEEKRLLARALKATKGNVRRAAQLLGIGRATLYRKIQVYQLRLN